MAKIITLDTSTSVCSVALHENGELVSFRFNKEEKSHSTHITLMVEQVLNESGCNFSDIDAFAVSKGPGSYTGLRIGVATAKGYCYALDKPLLSINTLDGIWLQAREKIDASFYIPMIDARRMEVYCKVFNKENSISDTEAKILDQDSFYEYLSDGKVVFCGDGSSKFKELLFENPNIIFLDDVYPDAKYMGNQVYKKFMEGGYEDVAYFEPYYLKDFVATKPKKALL